MRASGIHPSAGAGAPPAGGPEERRHFAIARARAATDTLLQLGVRVQVIGSLAKGCFGPGSDVDLLVLDCPRALKYTIEGLVEDCLQGLAFDLVYFDEIPPHKVDRFLEGAVDARHLR
ncbi:putative nucleotidyltransferase [Aquabacter spiritensis]|uniref:Putative nucleotidyltransferase n=1 Tax=Aquabacter spiritensis TaxID=933073 RepID=A0A4R3LYT4_9HYPH|nr:putative nucleotidyltransferase [Aquabacter spiritensis]